MKNLYRVVCNVSLVVLSVMMLGFGAGHYISGLGDGIGGYDWLERLQDALKLSTNAKPEVHLYIAGMIMFIIFATLLLSLALVSLLGDFSVIKNEKVNKALNICKIVMAILTLIANILVLASLIKTLEDSVLRIGYGMIINIVMAALSIGVVTFELLYARKRA